jgi:hypothetical protein
MRTVILGLAKGEAKTVVNVQSAEARAEYFRMKAALQAPEGCDEAVLVCYDRGCGLQDRFVVSEATPIVNEPKPKKESKVKSKLFGVLAAAVLAICALAFSANAENVPDGRYGPTPLTISSNVVGNTTAVGIGAVIDCRKQREVALAWNTGSSNVTVRIGSSVDGTRFQTNQYVLQLGHSAGDGTTTATQITNLTVGAIGWLRVDSVLSTGTITSTNTVYYGAK